MVERIERPGVSSLVRLWRQFSGPLRKRTSEGQGDEGGVPPTPEEIEEEGRKKIQAMKLEGYIQYAKDYQRLYGEFVPFYRRIRDLEGSESSDDLKFVNDTYRKAVALMKQIHAIDAQLDITVAGTPPARSQKLDKEI